MIILGEDLGFDRTKVYCKLIKFNFPSLIGKPSALELKQYKSKENKLEDLVVELNKNTYYVGDKALETTNPSRCIKSNKTNSIHDKILSDACLGYLLSNINTKVDDITIVTGLPISDMKLAKEIRKNMEGRKVFKYCDKDIEINVSRVRVIPQSAGAWFSYMLDDNGKVLEDKLNDFNGTTVVIDIGYKTTDVITMRGGEFISKESDSITYGMKNIHKEMIKEINKQHDMVFLLNEMDDICRAKSIIKNGNEISIIDIINRCSKAIIDAILSEIDIIANVDRSDVLLCCGGTMSIIYDYIDEYYSDHTNKHLLDEPEYSNAKGYYRYGVMLDGGKNEIKS